MHLEALVATYGYAAILLGTLLEGEVVVLVAGFLAHQGYLDPGGVVLAAFSGTLCSDQLAYFLGRSRGGAVLERRPAWKAKAARVFALLHRRRIPLTLGFRFLYGLRTVTPFVIGASGIRPREFVPWNVLGAAVWAAVLAGLGYSIGGALTVVVADAQRYELWVLAGAASLGALIWIGYALRGRLAAKVADPDGGL